MSRIGHRKSIPWTTAAKYIAHDEAVTSGPYAGNHTDGSIHRLHECSCGHEGFLDQQDRSGAIPIGADESSDETARSERGTCRTCGALFVLYGGFIPTHYDGKNVRCPGSRDVSREYSEANRLSEADLWRRFEGE